MTTLNSIGTIVSTGIVGLVCGGVLTDSYLLWYHQRNDMGAAILLAFNGLVGGVVGCIVGGIVASYAAETLWKSLAISNGCFLSASAVLALVLYLFSDYYPTPTVAGCELLLEAEFRFPAGAAKPFGDGTLKLTSMKNGQHYDSREGGLQLEMARLEEGQWIVPGSIKLFTSRPQRYVSASLDDKLLGEFDLAMVGYPGKKNMEWCQWQKTRKSDNLEANLEASAIAIRYKVSQIPPSRRLSESEYAAEVEAVAQAKFNNIPLDAAIDSWFPYIELHIPESRRRQAILNIVSKPGYISELNSLMLTDGEYDQAARRAASAMSVVASIENPSSQLVAGIADAGRDIMDRIRVFNSGLPEQDPSYEAASDADIRFLAWIQAADKLKRTKANDFTEQLQEILKLAEIRTDSLAMQNDVVRVGKYYLQRWAESNQSAQTTSANSPSRKGE